MDFTYKVATAHVLDELGVPKSFQHEIKDDLFGFPEIAYNLKEKIAVIPEVTDPFVLPSHSFVLFINSYSFRIWVKGAAESNNIEISVFSNADLDLFNEFPLTEIVSGALYHIKGIRLPSKNISVRKPRSTFNCVGRTAEEIIDYVNKLSEEVFLSDDKEAYSLLLSLIRFSEQVRFVELGDRTNWTGLSERAKEIFGSTFAQVADKLRAT